MTALVFDMEANGLLDVVDLSQRVDELYVFVGRELNTDTVVQYIGHKEISKKLPSLLSNYKSLIGHNILGYDIPVLIHLGIIEPEVYTTHAFKDTLVLSRLLYPDREGGHSIEAWGNRFGMHKVAHEDWSRYDPIMVDRCHEDVNICQRVYNRLVWEMDQ